MRLLVFGKGKEKGKGKASARDTDNVCQSQEVKNILADWAADRAGGVRKGKSYLEIGAELYSKTLLVREWPDSMKPAWINPILKGVLKNKLLPEGVCVRVSLHYVPAAIKWDSGTKRRIRRLQKSVESAEKTPGETPDPGEVKALQSIANMQEKTLYDNSSLADVWCLLTVFSENGDDLYFSVKRIEEVLGGMNFSVTHLPYEQTRGFLQGWIAGGMDKEFYEAYPGRLVDEDAAAVLMPFTHGSLSDGASGSTYMGHRIEEENNSICFIDLAEGGDPEGNKNMVVLGSSGQGKSTFLKALVNSLLLEGYLVIVFDVDGEYKAICDYVGGLWIDHTMASGRYVDPFKIPLPLNENHPDPETARMIKHENSQRLENVLNGVMRLASLLAGGLSPFELNAADRALTELWERIGVKRDDPYTWDKCREYTIHHWYETLKGLNFPGCHELSEKIWRYFEGAQSKMFSIPEEININDQNLVVFHVASSINNESDEHTAAVKMSLASDAVWEAVKRNKAAGKRWSAVIYDEGQRVLKDKRENANINNLATTIRKWNGLVALATNNPGVLFMESGGKDGSVDASGLWSNSAFKVLFWLEQRDMKIVAENSELPGEVLNKLKGLNKTKAFILRYMDKNAYDVLRLRLPDQEARMVKTRKIDTA